MSKTIGKRKILDPERLEALNREMDELRSYKKPKGLVFRFKTYKELDEFNLACVAKKI